MWRGIWIKGRIGAKHPGPYCGRRDERCAGRSQRGARPRASVDRTDCQQHAKRQQATSTELADLKRKRARLNAEIGQFSNSAAKLGIVLEVSGSPIPVKQLQTLGNRIQQEIKKLDQQLKEIAVGAEAARAGLANAKAQVAGKAAEIVKWKAAQARLREESIRLGDDPRTAQYPSMLTRNNSRNSNA